MSFENIIGYANEKKELMHLSKILRNIGMYRERGLRMPKGLLLVGEPGVGKSAMARNMAVDGISLLELRAAECCGEEIGGAIHEAFEQAKEQAPCILLLDELDKTAGTSAEFFAEPNDEVKKVLLQELDSLSGSDDVLVVATCNDVTALGEALTRPGRFDHTLVVDLPDQETRKKILSHYFKKVKLRKFFHLEELAKLTAGFSCADLECLVNESGLSVLEKGKKSIGTADVEEIVNRMSFHGQSRDASDKEEERYRIAVHEAGHALTAMYISPESVYGASILPQGESLGHVRMMQDDAVGLTTEDLQNHICIALAGRVAEREVLGKQYLGSQSDLEKAAKMMMDLLVPNAAFGYRNMLCMFPFVKEAGDNVGDAFEKQMNALDRKATLLIQENRGLFDSIVCNLVNQRTLSKEQLFELKAAAEKAQSEDKVA